MTSGVRCSMISIAHLLMGIMPGPQPEVTAEQILDLTTEVLQTHLNFSTEGTKCSTPDVLRLLVAASAERGGGEAGPVGGEAVRAGLVGEVPGRRGDSVGQVGFEAVEAGPVWWWRVFQSGAGSALNSGSS